MLAAEPRRCQTCTAERASRALVALKANDPRFHSSTFVSAPAVFANNDIKYETNKLRARLFAHATRKPVTYAVAKDTCSSEALRAKPDLSTQKLSWLQRHDRESGDLYGMMPLVEGMPVALTDHVDRSVEKSLLRGKVGRIHSWVPHREECSEFVDGARILKHLPAVVFVKYVKKNGSDVPWTLDGLEEPGLYPIVPRKGCFFLDKGRMHPVLQIRRQQ